MRRRRFASGSWVFREGDESDEAFLLRAGRVEVLKESPSGPLRLAVLGPGDVVGEMGLLDERPRSASAHALDDVEADAMNAAEFEAILTSDPARSIEVLRAMFERLRAVNDRLSESIPTRADGLPTVRIVGTTPETTRALPDEGRVVERFPFRVGRTVHEDSGDLLHFNELALDDVQPHVLGANHFAIDLGPQGPIVRDRGSRYGTVVNGARIGGGADTDVAPLHLGENDVIAGPPRQLASMRASPFRFRIDVG